MIERLDNILKKYNELTEELLKPEVLSNIDLLTKLSKEQRSLEEVTNVYKEYKNVLNAIEDNKELLKDNEYKDLAKEELEILNPRKEELEQKVREYYEISINNSEEK